MQLGEEIHITLKPRWWWPLLAGALFGLVLRAIYSGSPGALFETMSGSFALLAPIAISAVTVFVAELRARRTWAYYFWMGALANVLFTVGTFLIHLEGLICVILAAPLFTLIGGVRRIDRRRGVPLGALDAPRDLLPGVVAAAAGHVRALHPAAATGPHDRAHDRRRGAACRRVGPTHDGGADQAE